MKQSQAMTATPGSSRLNPLRRTPQPLGRRVPTRCRPAARTARP